MTSWDMAVPIGPADPMLRHDLYTDLLTFTFCGPTPYTLNQLLFIDAEDPSRSFTAAQFRQLVRTLIAGFKTHNVQPGDCVLLHLGNSVSGIQPGIQPHNRRLTYLLRQILYPALFFAIIGAGGVYMGSNPRSSSQELEHIIDLAEPKLILTARDTLPMILDVAAGRGIHPARVCVVDERAIDYCAQLFLWYELGYPAGAQFFAMSSIDGPQLNFVHLLWFGESDWIMFSDPMTAQSTPAAMFSTSGTGGLPKAAILSHHAIVSQHRSIQYDVPYSVSRLMSLPMFHLFGALWTHIFPARYGHPLFILPRFEISQFLATVSRYRISETYLVPAVVHAINRSSLPVSDSLASLRYVGVGGAPMDGASMQQFRSHLHVHAFASQLWGMTEAGIAFQTRYGQRGNPGSIGTCLPGFEVCLVDHAGRVVHSDERSGELHVRGPSLMLGYKGRADDKDEHGWFRTGDVAYVKNDQYFIVGRSKELIKVRG